MMFFAVVFTNHPKIFLFGLPLSLLGCTIELFRWLIRSTFYTENKSVGTVVEEFLFSVTRFGIGETSLEDIPQTGFLQYGVFGIFYFTRECSECQNVVSLFFVSGICSYRGG